MGEGAREDEAPALDNKRGTNVAGILSLRRSRASTTKVDAPSVTERVPASAWPGVVSPAARSSTKMVEKRCPPPAERSHQNATSPLWKGGAGHTAQKCPKLGTKAPCLPLKHHKKSSLRSSHSLCARTKGRRRQISTGWAGHWSPRRSKIGGKPRAPALGSPLKASSSSLDRCYQNLLQRHV